MAETSDKPIQLGDDEALRCVQVIESDLSASRTAVSGHLEDVEEWRGLLDWQDEDEAEMFPGAIIMRKPFIKESIIAIMAEIFPSLLNVDPMIHVEGISKQWKPLADEYESFRFAMHDRYTGLKDCMRKVLFNGLRDGAAVVMTTWEHREDYTWEWAPEQTEIIDTDAQQSVGMMVKMKASRSYGVVADYPKYTVIPIDRFGTLPAQHADIQRSPGCWVQWFVDGNYLRQMAEAGEFDKAAVDEILATEASVADNTTAEDDGREVTAHQVDTSDEHDELRQDIAITEVYYRYKPQGETLAQDWLFTIEEDSQTLLRAVPCPWWHGKRPFALFRPYYKGEGVMGESLASAGGAHTQKALSTFLTQSANAMWLGLDPRKAVPASMYSMLAKVFGKNAKEEFRRPGACFPVPDTMFNTGGKLYEPMMPGFSPNVVQGLYELVSKEGQMSVGAQDTLKGGQLENITATHAQQLLEASKRLIGLILENLAETMKEVAEQEHSLLYQFQDSEILRDLWEDLHGDKGIPYDFALVGHYTHAANGMTETTNLTIRAGRALERLKILSADQTVWSNPKLRYNSLFSVIRDTGTRAPEEFLGSEEEYTQNDQRWQMLLQLEQMMAGAQAAGGMVPGPGMGGQAGAASSPSSAMPPALMGATNG